MNLLNKCTDKEVKLMKNAGVYLEDKDASGIVLLKSYEDYYYGYEDDKGKHQKGYEGRIAELIQKYPLGEQII